MSANQFSTLKGGDLKSMWASRLVWKFQIPLFKVKNYFPSLRRLQFLLCKVKNLLTSLLRLQTPPFTVENYHESLLRPQILPPKVENQFTYKPTSASGFTFQIGELVYRPAPFRTPPFMVKNQFRSLHRLQISLFTVESQFASLRRFHLSKLRTNLEAHMEGLKTQALAVKTQFRSLLSRLNLYGALWSILEAPGTKDQDSRTEVPELLSLIQYVASAVQFQVPPSTVDNQIRSLHRLQFIFFQSRGLVYRPRSTQFPSFKSRTSLQAYIDFNFYFLRPRTSL